MASAERTEILEVPLEKLYKTIIDISSYPRFVNGVKAVRDEGGGKWFFDVEMVQRVNYVLAFSQSSDAQQASVSWHLHASEFFRKSSGAWKLKALSPQRTEATYSLDVEFNLPIPGFILKGLIAKEIPKTIRSFFEESSKR